MSNALIATILAAGVLGPALQAQEPPNPPQPAPSPITMTGCVSAKPETSGKYTFAEADGIREYRLTGKGVRKFAGQRVEVVGGSPGGGLAIKGGLWPAPSGGARGVAQDPAQASIAIHDARGGAGAPGEFPEFRVTKVRLVPGVCE